jgi:hypothetical protein
MPRSSWRSRIVVVLGTTLVVATLAPLNAASAGPLVLTVADPGTVTAPSQQFIATCDGAGTSPAANQACDGVAIPEFNRARAKEGVKPLVLPEAFDTLSVPLQVLTITNMERVDRGLPPVPGLSSYLNGLAQQGANANDHPPLAPLTGRTQATVNWAGTDSALLGAFMWMYWDGPGGGNLGCQNTGDQGCWGHRHNLMYSYESPIAMGAGVAPGSLAQEIVGGDTADPIDVTPTWADISGTLTYGVAPVNVTKTADVGTSQSATITATSAGGSGHLEVGFQSGTPTWSVSPDDCDLVPNGSCQFVVTFAPTTVGNFPGVFTVSDGTTVKTVALSGTGIEPRVTLGVNADRISRGSKLVVRGVVTADPTNAALARRDVALQRKLSGQGWKTVDSDTSGGRGKVKYVLHPNKSAKYRLEVIAAGGAVQAKSSSVKVRVTR